MSEEIILQTTNQAAFEDLFDDLNGGSSGRKMAESSSSGSAPKNTKENPTK